LKGYNFFLHCVELEKSLEVSIYFSIFYAMVWFLAKSGTKSVFLALGTNKISDFRGFHEGKVNLVPKPLTACWS
jgi:hypothetical protein